MSERLQIVTIDGPSGVGKSTVSRKLATALRYTYLDTGAMYRAVAYCCKQVEIEDQHTMEHVLASLELELLPPLDGDDDVRVLLNGREIGDLIRTPEMGMLASKVSSLPLVRQKLTAMQQDIGKSGKIVAEGRDTGTVVFPGASWKFYLDASPEERAGRRIEQLESKGIEVDKDEVLAQIIQRDRDDSQRSIAPLTRAEDAVMIDSSILNADEVVERMLAVIR